MICAAGNLLHRADALTGTFEDFCYDGLNRLTEYAAGNGVTACTSPQNHKTVGYNDLGNIVAKSDAGTYGYPTSGGGTGSRPHALASVSGTVNATVNPNYHYDANGNLDCEYTDSYPSDCVGVGASRKVVYTAFNMADTITKGTTSVAFGYDSSHDRVSQRLTVGSTTTVTTYLNDPFTGAMSEKAVTGATTTWSDYVSADGRLVALRSCTGAAPCSSGVTMKYFIADHLGSVAVVMDATGNPLTAAHLAYDPWGRRRNADGSDVLCGANPSAPSRGFTGHEHIDDACLINMNARLYDPILGRFMAADSIVPDPLDLQSLNRYSYVVNGPLSFTDPTGREKTETVIVHGPWQLDNAEGGNSIGILGTTSHAIFGGKHIIVPIKPDDIETVIVTGVKATREVSAIRSTTDGLWDFDIVPVTETVTVIGYVTNKGNWTKLGQCLLSHGLLKGQSSVGLQAGAKVSIPGFKFGGKVDFGSLNFGWSNNGSFFLTESQGASFTAKAGIKNFGAGGTWGFNRSGPALEPQTANDNLSGQPWTAVNDDFLGFSASGSLLGGFELKAGINEGDVSQCMRDSGF